MVVGAGMRPGDVSPSPHHQAWNRPQPSVTSVDANGEQNLRCARDGPWPNVPLGSGVSGGSPRGVAELVCAECGREPRDNENAADEWRCYSTGIELVVFCLNARTA